MNYLDEAVTKSLDEFMEYYKVVDTEEIYSNGIELVPIFRVKQWEEYNNKDKEIEILNGALQTHEILLKSNVLEIERLNIKYSDQIEKYKDIVLDLENERDILKSKLSETKADIHYLLENGESIYIRNKYIRGDIKDE